MKPTLVIMAAGMGSRYGGLKQIDPVGPSGEVIIEYSLYDAKQAGFESVVFIIREDFEQAFRNAIGNKLDGKMEVSYAFQALDSRIGDHSIPEGREKPWGTAHAILIADEVVNGPFGVINADDYYGRDSFKILYDFLSDENGSDSEFSLVGYTLRNTLSEHGHVSRGVCVAENSYLNKVNECKKIYKNGNAAIYEDDAGAKSDLTGDEIVSMNMWGFKPSLFGHLESGMTTFLAEEGNELKSEYLIPDVVDTLVNNGTAKCRILPTDATWFGVTYPEDKPIVVESIKKLHDAGTYPEKLWG